MATFRFTLEPVLSQRLAAEREKQRAVATLERELLEIEGEIVRLQRGMVGARQDWRDALAPRVGSPTDMTHVRMQAQESFRLFVGARRLALRLAGAHRRIDAARAELLAASRARRAVELLKEKRYAEWKRAQARLEMAALDELVVMRAGRRALDLLHAPIGLEVDAGDAPREAPE